MDRNCWRYHSRLPNIPSLSARRAWIEMWCRCWWLSGRRVALRKESVDRNAKGRAVQRVLGVALRKESVDRNTALLKSVKSMSVALRKESVDRNCEDIPHCQEMVRSLSARRAWIEISRAASCQQRNQSLSARRAWIEIGYPACWCPSCWVALRKESVDRNQISGSRFPVRNGRSPQGERG